MGKYTTYIGMDVHARSVTAKGVVIETGEHVSRHFSAGYSAGEIASWLAKLPQPVYCAYESGCTGVWLARDLRALGYACDVIAISTLPRSTKDRQEKCDKLDAKMVLSAIANPCSKHSCVWIPTEEQEGERELVRLYAKARDGAKRAKQELVSFLLRHGYAWNEKTKTGKTKKPSGRAFEAWLDSISFKDGPTSAAYGEYRRRAQEAEADKRRIAGMVREQARSEKNAVIVAALTCLKGVDELTAATISAEIGDFERFSGGRKVSCWLGTVPKNNSSGEKDRKGALTKAGDKYLRRALIEGVSAISLWKGPRKEPPRPGVPPAAAAMARRANERLYERYERLRHDASKNTNVVKVAIANELARWAWAIGREIQRAQPGL